MSIVSPEQVLGQLAEVRQRVEVAAQSSGRSAVDISLVAVSKGVDNDLVKAVRQAGQVDLGEARARELKTRQDIPELPRARWHFIGRLQRNDVPKVVGIASIIHSVDSYELAEAISDEALRKGKVQRCLVQVNIDNDPNKAGVSKEDCIKLIARVRNLLGISIIGLTTIGGLDVPPDETYGSLASLRDDVRSRWPEILHLSMGMSKDFEIAIAHGATVLRVGSAIFGDRKNED